MNNSTMWKNKVIEISRTMIFLLLLPVLIYISLILHTLSPRADIIFIPISDFLIKVVDLLSPGEYALDNGKLFAAADDYCAYETVVSPQPGGSLDDALFWPAAWLPFVGFPRFSVLTVRWAWRLSVVSVILFILLNLLLHQIKYKKILIYYIILSALITLYAARFTAVFGASIINTYPYYIHSSTYGLTLEGLTWSCVVFIPLATMSLLLGLTYGFPKRPYAKGHCGQCGYDCAGLAVCPECGNTDPAARPSQGIRYFFRPVTYFSLFVCSLFLPSFVSLGIKLFGAITG